MSYTPYTSDNENLSLILRDIAGGFSASIANLSGITIPSFSTTGILHNNSSGVFSSSLVVNADISASAAIVDTKLSTISTALKVSNSATTATNLNTVNAIVSRDGFGNFSAGTISAALTGNATTATALQTSRSIYGNNFDGTAPLAQIITSVYGGTGNGFTKFSGPAASEKTFTLPNANATILTDNTVITLAQGGTSASLVANNGGVVYSSASAMAILSGTATANKILLSGAASAPTWSIPTFPNASATTGKLIISDGTNWIASTPVFPNSFAQGDLLFGSATNVISALTKDTNATRYLSNTGTTNNPAWAQINLANGVSGVLSLANGGSGTSTSFTAGSVVFAGASGIYTQDNTNLFWDDSNNRLGIGTATPSVGLEVLGDTLIQRNTTNGSTASLGISSGNASSVVNTGIARTYQEMFSSVGVSLKLTNDLQFNSTEGIYESFIYRSQAALQRIRTIPYINSGGDVQLIPKFVLSGQEFLNAATTSTDGVSLLLFRNIANNRQLAFADTARLTVNSTNPTIDFTLNANGTRPTIRAVATDGSTALEIGLNSGGGDVTIGSSGSAVVIPGTVTMAGTVNADITGAATQITPVNTTGGGTYLVGFLSSSVNNGPVRTHSSNFTYNPGTQTLNAGNITVSGATLQANYVMNLPNSGTQKARANAWDTYSDGDLKTDKKTLPGAEALQICHGLHSIYYHWIKGQGDNIIGMTPQRHIGVIAQEAQKITPWLCTLDKTGVARAYNYAGLTPILSAAISEVDKNVAVLKEEIRELKSQLKLRKLL